MESSSSERSAGLCRFVVPVGSTAPLETDGFLASEAYQQGPNGTPRRVDALVGTPTSYLLLGAGGAGKTHTLQALAAAEGMPYASLAGYSFSEIRKRLDTAVLSGLPVYLDTIDQFGEAAQLKRLVDELGEAAKEGARLRLGCRTALWRRSFASKLKALPCGFETLLLSPLDRVSAALIADGQGIDGGVFIDAAGSARGRRI